MYQYKLRIVSQALVLLFVVLSAGVKLGYAIHPPTMLLFAALASALWLASCRTTWLPFLGSTVMPTGLLTPQTPRDSDMSVMLTAPKSAVRCIYWGSVTSAKNPIQAYGGFSNGGIADVVNGRVKLSLLRPKPYSVYTGKILAPHVHYRWIGARGILSEVKTVAITS
jgi:hypothetical protein